MGNDYVHLVVCKKKCNVTEWEIIFTKLRKWLEGMEKVVLQAFSHLYQNMNFTLLKSRIKPYFTQQELFENTYNTRRETVLCSG